MPRRQRVYSRNPQGVAQAGSSYNPRSDISREELANALYRLLNQKSGFSSSKSLRQINIGEQLIYTKKFSNGMELTIFPSIVAEADQTKKSGKALRSTGYGQGRVYFSLKYTIPESYASSAGISPKLFTFNSVPVNRTGTISQIVARINGSINSLEQYAQYIRNPAAYFSKIVRSDNLAGAESDIHKSTKVKVTGTMEDVAGSNNLPDDFYLPERQYGMDPEYDPPPEGIKVESIRRIVRKLILESF